MSRYDRERERERPASAALVHPTRPHSSLAYPRPTSAFGHQSQPKTPSAARFGGLEPKVLHQVMTSIQKASKTTGAAAHRSRPTREHNELVEINETSVRGEPAPRGSFLAETSFSRAPLNSRLPPISPRRVTLGADADLSRKDSRGKGRVENDTFGSSGDGVLLDEANLEDEEEAPTAKEEKESLEGLPANLQEALLVEDLLFVLMGIEGQYIEFDPSYSPEDEYERLGGAQFVVDPLILPWLKDLVMGFLPLAKCYTSVRAFVEQYSVLELGVINHALCAALREMLRDYLILLAQLEDQFLTSPTFSLRTLWFYLNPTVHTLSLLHNLTSALVSLNLPSDTSTSSSSSLDASSDDDIQNEDLRNLARAGTAAAANLAQSDQKGWNQAGGLAKGGEVLSVLSSLLSRTSGDPVALKVYSSLLLRASQPYAVILLAWVTTGQLADSWEEFIVKETKGITRGSLELDYTDEYWDKRYTLRDKGSKGGARGGLTPRARGLAGGAVVPPFLEPWKVKILLAGKYLNVIRECGIEIKAHDAAPPGLVNMNDEAFFQRIDDAYTYANKLLLKTLLEEQLLAARLQSIKQYFFLDPADVFTHFLDIAKTDLAKKTRIVSLSKLQSLLELALRSLPMATDPFKDDLRVMLHKATLTDWLVNINKIDGSIGGRGGDGDDKLGSGLLEQKHNEDAGQDGKAKDIIASDAFTLDYVVRFPLNVVISKKIILRYQLVFRYLLQLKLLERTLAETWAEQTKSNLWRKRSPYAELEKWKGRVFALRARMYSFVQQMYSFAVGEVLEPNWRLMEAKLAKIETVDQLLKDHVDFLDTCLNALLLTNEKILVLHNRLITTCALFASYTGNFTKTIAHTIAVSETNGSWSSASFARNWEFLAKFEQHFNHHFKTHLEYVGLTASRENTALLPLSVRLSSLKLPGE